MRNRFWPCQSLTSIDSIPVRKDHGRHTRARQRLAANDRPPRRMDRQHARARPEHALSDAVRARRLLGRRPAAPAEPRSNPPRQHGLLPSVRLLPLVLLRYDSYSQDTGKRPDENWRSCMRSHARPRPMRSSSPLPSSSSSLLPLTSNTNAIF